MAWVDPSEPGGYSSTDAMRAVGISYRQIDYWARTGVVVPSVANPRGSGTARRYSPRDLDALRVVKFLRAFTITVEQGLLREIAHHVQMAGVTGRFDLMPGLTLDLDRFGQEVAA